MAPTSPPYSALLPQILPLLQFPVRVDSRGRALSAAPAPSPSLSALRPAAHPPTACWLPSPWCPPAEMGSRERLAWVGETLRGWEPGLKSLGREGASQGGGRGFFSLTPELAACGKPCPTAGGPAGLWLPSLGLGPQTPISGQQERENLSRKTTGARLGGCRTSPISCGMSLSRRDFHYMTQGKVHRASLLPARPGQAQRPCGGVRGVGESPASGA